MILPFFLALSGLFLGPVAGVPTCAQIASMSSDLLNLMLSPHATPSTNLHPMALRLGFHDCVGGCNGCLNFNNPDNAGLQPAVSNFTSLYYAKGYNNIVSLADFYALATVVSIRSAVQVSNNQRTGTPNSPCPVPCFTTQWGRVDAADCSNDASVLPSPRMTGDQMFNYFKNEFGFSRSQTVALMGAHSFGAAFTENSGYSGKWTSNANNGISEIFYSLMIDPKNTYTNVNVGTTTVPKYEFRGKANDGTNVGIMFNTDFEVFYNLTLDADAKLTCTLNNACGLTDTCTGFCPKSSTFSTALTYAQNCSAFITDFTSVISLMLSRGYSKSQLASTTCPCS